MARIPIGVPILRTVYMQVSLEEAMLHKRPQIESDTGFLHTRLYTSRRARTSFRTGRRQQHKRVREEYIGRCLQVIHGAIAPAVLII